ncbi:MAG: NrdH-redoxin [Alphaproteobacteria bacterium]|nr:MAG: NrdH-redoxin [Alphaproteobacteria bacterium]
MAQATAEPAIKAYWQPGCTSCLRMKEFLTRHGVPFVSVNVLADKAAFAELAELGIRSVPIVRRGKDWANGQVLKDVARVAGIKWGGAKMLPVPELVSRLVTIQQAAQRLFAQIPDDKLGQQLPNRPRSYAQLAYHIFNIADAFLEHEVQGLPLKEGAYNRVPPPEMKTKEQILDYGRNVLSGIETWWRGPGQTANFDTKASVYYGSVTLHDYLERTTWHSGQHVRQMMMVLGMLGIAPDRPVGKETFDGLPMPDKVWDDEKPAA